MSCKKHNNFYRQMLLFLCAIILLVISRANHYNVPPDESKTEDELLTTQTMAFRISALNLVNKENLNPNDFIESNNKRKLADICLVAHCNKCSKTERICIECKTGYNLKDTYCEISKKIEKKEAKEAKTNEKFSKYILIIIVPSTIISIAFCG